MDFIEQVKTLFTRKKEKPLSAEEAYFRTKYGVYKTTDQRILDRQKSVRELIKAKITPGYRAEINFSSYYCVIDLEDELKPYVDEIFKPFKEEGFKVFNLSELVEDINNDLVFLISWYKTDFQKKSK